MVLGLSLAEPQQKTDPEISGQTAFHVVVFFDFSAVSAGAVM
jgi:hypothetical protein